MGKWIPVAETNPASLDAHHEPYVLWRHTRHKLYRAVDDENQLNEQLFALQTRCQHYETIIVQGIQKAIKDYSESATKEGKYSITVASELNGTSLHNPFLCYLANSAIALGVPPEKEWEAFTNREPALLKPDHKPRDPLTATFPFHDHPLVKPVLEGRLDRKSTLLKRRQPAHYVLTPSGFLLEFKDADVILNPDPTLSLKLWDCVLGPRGDKSGFTLKGKDVGKSFGPSRSHEYVFHTDSPQQATLWWDAISKFVSNETGPTSPTSPDEPTALPVNTTTKPVAVPPRDQRIAPAAVQTPAPAASATQHQPTQTAGPTSQEHAGGHMTAAPTSTATHAQNAATTAAQGSAPPTTTRGAS